MNRAETLTIMAILQAAYPQFYAGKSKAEQEVNVALWTEMFADEPAMTVAMAVKALIKTRVSTYPPGIGEINEKIMQLTQPEEMSGMEAWNIVAKAVRNSGYNSKEEFDKLPPTIKRIVGSPAQLKEWSMMDSDTFGSVVASNFQRSYKSMAKRERETQALPSSVKAYIEALAKKMSPPQIEGRTE